MERLLAVLVVLSVVPACSGGNHTAAAGDYPGEDAGDIVDAGDAGYVVDASDAGGDGALDCGGACAVGSTCQPDGYCWFPCTTVLECKLHDASFTACTSGFCTINDGGP